MRRGIIQATSVLAGSFALLAAAANAQPLGVHRVRHIEAVYSPTDTLNQSVARVAVQSTLPRPADAQISRQDMLSLMVLLSLPNKHPS